MMIKVMAIVILRSRSSQNEMVMCFDFYPEAGGWLSSECLSFSFPIKCCLTAHTHHSLPGVSRSEAMKMMKLALMFMIIVPSIGASCNEPFRQTNHGCFYMQNRWDQKAWMEAEAVCQEYGSHVHLATTDSEEVCPMVYQMGIIDFFLIDFFTTFKFFLKIPQPMLGVEPQTSGL